MNSITQNLEPLKNRLRNHSLYSKIKDVDDLNVFSNAHVYAVWDFMSLLKFLQINLTSISIPWFPSKNTTTAKLINEIVAGEETDEDQKGQPVSHFEMYIDSIEEFGLNTSEIIFPKMGAIFEKYYWALLQNDTFSQQKKMCGDED